jgi:SAM-dependent methyltransferase
MSDPQRLADKMRCDWDARAEHDAMYYIDTRSDAWEPSAFFEQGAGEARELIGPVLERFDFDPAGKRLLEIGCGLGRLFPGFAAVFSEVWGIDVSPAMIERAKRVCPVPGVQFTVGSGVDLAGISDTSVDYCFSYLVFPHLPDRALVWGYLDEIWRVLRPGGLCQLQFRSSESLDAAVARRLPIPAARLAQRLTHHVVPGSLATWAGVTVSRREVIGHLEHLGFLDAGIFPGDVNDRSRVFWAVAKKP